MLGETVANWERGLTKPLIRHWPAILKFLGSDPQPPPESLPGRLRAIRKRLGLTQAALAARLGQDEKQVCRWELGRQAPHRWIAARIDLTLRVLEGHPAEGPQNPLTYFDLTRWRRRPPGDGVPIRPKTFGEYLRHRRLALGLSQEQAGRLLGVSRAVVYRWERDSVPVPSSRIAAVRRFLKGSTHRRGNE